MCIRDRLNYEHQPANTPYRSTHAIYVRKLADQAFDAVNTCLLYTSDAADERSSVDLGGRRIIKKKKRKYIKWSEADIIYIQ